MVSQLEEEFDPGEIAAGFAKLAVTATQPRSLVGPTAVDDGAKPETGMARVYIGAGRRDGVRPGDIVGAIANEAGIAGREIGAIDIFDEYTFVEVPAARRDEIVGVLSNTRIKGNRVRIEAAQPRTPSPAEERGERRRPARRDEADGRPRGEPRGSAGEEPVEEAPGELADAAPPFRREEGAAGTGRPERRPPPSWERAAAGERARRPLPARGDEAPPPRPARRRDDEAPPRPARQRDDEAPARPAAPPWLRRAE
jgi:hypothetical protein